MGSATLHIQKENIVYYLNSDMQNNLNFDQTYRITQTKNCPSER